MSDAQHYLTLLERFVNQNNKSTRNDQFHVNFYGLPENIANYLGKQVKNITRPGLDFMTSENRNRQNVWRDTHNVLFDQVTLSFHDDEDGLTSRLLYTQIFRQINKYPDLMGQWGLDRDYKFDIEVKLFNASGAVKENYIMRDVFIKSISHSDLAYADNNNSEIRVVVEYNNIDYRIFDEMLSIRA